MTQSLLVNSLGEILFTSLISLEIFTDPFELLNVEAVEAEATVVGASINFSGVSLLFC